MTKAFLSAFLCFILLASFGLAISINETTGWINTFSEDSQELSSLTKQVKIRDGILLKVQSNQVHVGVIDVTSSNVLLNVSSTYNFNLANNRTAYRPDQTTLRIGESEEFNTSPTVENDLKITLLSVEFRKVILTLEQINTDAAVVANALVVEDAVEPTTADITDNTTSGSTDVATDSATTTDTAVPTTGAKSKKSSKKTTIPSKKSKSASSFSVPMPLIIIVGAIILLGLILVFMPKKKEKPHVIPLAKPKVHKLVDARTLTFIKKQLKANHSLDAIEYMLVEQDFPTEEAHKKIHYFTIDSFVATEIDKGTSKKDIETKLGKQGLPRALLAKIFG
ncbi:MAG: hypothetical protein ACI8Y7_000413 [Candidatus Woesearchaeota archaeon]|jgi:hypothetical protein